jgi:hypothetical protein
MSLFDTIRWPILELKTYEEYERLPELLLVTWWRHLLFDFYGRATNSSTDKMEIIHQSLTWYRNKIDHPKKEQNRKRLIEMISEWDT